MSTPRRSTRRRQVVQEAEVATMATQSSSEEENTIGTPRRKSRARGRGANQSSPTKRAMKKDTPSTPASVSVRSPSRSPSRGGSRSRRANDKGDVTHSILHSDDGSDTREAEHALMYNNTYYFRRVVDPVTQVFYQPHSISLLLTMMAGFLYVALYRTVDENVITNTKMGLFAAATVLFFVGINEFPNGPFIRPHPIFWRGVLTCSVIYLLFLVFILFQKVEDARQLMYYYDHDLGVPLPERSYAESCDLTWENVMNQMDIFIIAHSLGWFGKALIIRDFWLLWVYSIMFEVMEYSLQHQLANFAECWWDHWILDVLICNGLGIYLGMKACKFFQMRTYSWRTISETRGIRAKLRRSLAQFTPHDWQPIVWSATSSLKNFGSVVVLVIFYIWAEVNSFYLKYLLWLPTNHYLNIIRLVLLVAMGGVATREMHQYLTLASCRRLGPQAFLSVCVIWTETLIVIKFGRDEFPNPAPPHVILFWCVFLTLLVAYAVRLCWLDYHRSGRYESQTRKLR